MPVVMGTAGHIDHGKTSLVNALTGINCDRLEEEHRRGITIELGFARLDLPNGKQLSIIDVPGHERFVHTMMSGASGIDFVMLVIAADEGVMPQTREHLEICSLLGIKRGIVALTKTDMVDPELLEMAKEDIANLVKGTFMEFAPVFPVSAQTGQGIENLRNALAALEEQLGPQKRSDLFRLPIDRVFTLKGYGTIVTGTMIGGNISAGENAAIYPTGITTKVRSIQKHGDPAEQVPAGNRTALNLQNLAVEDISRGDVVARPGTLFPTKRWLVYLNCLPSAPRPLRQRKEIHLHHGSASHLARLHFFDREQLVPGESALCELRLASPATAVFADRCVIRSFSPLQAVAGGAVILPDSPIIRKRDPQYAAKLSLLDTLYQTMQEEEIASEISDIVSNRSHMEDIYQKRILALLGLYGAKGLAFAELAVSSNINSRPLQDALLHLGSKQQAFCVDKENKVYCSAEALKPMYMDCLDFFARFHRANPLKPGMARNEVLSSWGQSLSPKLVHFILEKLLQQKQLIIENDLLRLPEHTVSLASDQSQLRDIIYKTHVEAGLNPPNMKDVLEHIGVSLKEALPVLTLMQQEKQLTKVSDAIWYSTAAIEELKQQIRLWFKSHDHLDLAGLKELTGLSRKYLVALLEYFDNEHFTARIGDKRILRQMDK